jgi:hypothetical protein
MNERAGEAVKKIIPDGQNTKETIPFDPKSKEVRADGDPDRTGQAIVSLLQEAAEAANTNCDRTMGLAHKLSTQLRAAEERIPQLELEMRHHRDRAQRAEQWMARIYNDIKQKFFEEAPPAAERAR